MRHLLVLTLLFAAASCFVPKTKDSDKYFLVQPQQPVTYSSDDFCISWEFYSTEPFTIDFLIDGTIVTDKNYVNVTRCEIKDNSFEVNTYTVNITSKVNAIVYMSDHTGICSVDIVIIVVLVVSIPLLSLAIAVIILCCCYFQIACKIISCCRPTNKDTPTVVELQQV